MCLRQAQTSIFGAFDRLRHRVIKGLVAELVEATVGGIFLLGFGVSITQSSRRVVEMMAFLSSQSVNRQQKVDTIY